MDEQDKGEQIVQAMAGLLHTALVAGAGYWAKLDLTMPQLKTLLLLGQQGSATVSWLAGSMHVSPPNVTGILDRLEGRGLVRRTSDRSDRRVVRIVLTEGGTALLADMERAGLGAVTEAVHRLGARQRSALLEGLMALTRSGGA